jgi:transposase
MIPGLFDKMINILDRLDPPQRARKLSNRDVLECAVFVLRTGVGWRDIKHLTNASPMTAYSRYNSWVVRGFIAKVWNELLQQYSARRLKRNPHWFKSLFIDSSMIKNVAGIDCTGKNSTDRGRKATKLSTICDENQVPVAAVFFPANESDVNTIEATVASIHCPIRRDARYNNVLIGDKGYISSETGGYLKELGIKLLTPPKVNSRNKKRSKVEILQLRKRHCVENLFCRLDKFKRIHVRRDKTIAMFEAMHQLAFCIVIVQRLNDMDKD